MSASLPDVDFEVIRASCRIGAKAVLMIDAAAQYVDQHPDRPEHRNDGGQQRPSAPSGVVEALGGERNRAPEKSDREDGRADLAKPGAGKAAEGGAYECGNDDPGQPFAAGNTTAAQKESGGEGG